MGKGSGVGATGDDEPPGVLLQDAWTADADAADADAAGAAGAAKPPNSFAESREEVRTEEATETSDMTEKGREQPGAAEGGVASAGVVQCDHIVQSLREREMRRKAFKAIPWSLLQLLV